MRRAWRRIPKLALVAGLCSSALVLSFTYTVTKNADTITHNCRQIETIKTEIRGAINSSLATLGQPGSAGYGYYRDHPDELAQAVKLATAQLASFGATPCR